MDKITLKYTIKAGCPIQNPIKPPTYKGDIGYNLGAAIQEDELIIEPYKFIDVPTCVHVELPPNMWGLMTQRSSTYAKKKLMVLSAVIDEGYRGELSVFILNVNPTPVKINKGDYLAQLVLMPSTVCELELVDTLSDSERGHKGFGSSDHPIAETTRVP